MGSALQAAAPVAAAAPPPAAAAQSADVREMDAQKGVQEVGKGQKGKIKDPSDPTEESRLAGLVSRKISRAAERMGAIG